MASLYEIWKRRHKGAEILEDLEKWPEIPKASSVVQRLKDATERAHQRRKSAFDKWKRKP